MGSEIIEKIDKEDRIDYYYHHFKIDHDEHTFLLRDITNYLEKKIFNKLNCEEESKLYRYKLLKIKNHLLLEFFLDGGPLDLIFALDVIYHATNNITSLVPFEETEIWSEVIGAALDYNTIFKDSYVKSTSELEKSEIRLYNVGNAAKYFKNEGYSVKIENGNVKIDAEDLEKICLDIERCIMMLGCINFTANLFNMLSDLYNEEQERYNLNRINGFGGNPLIPVGYLLNLAVKNANSNPVPPKSRKIWLNRYNQLLHKSANLGAIFNVQPYFHFELMFKRPIEIIEFIQEIAIFDSIFSLTQLKPSYVTRILDGLFGVIDTNEMEEKLGFNLDDYINIIIYIFKMSKKTNIPIIFRKSDLFPYFDLNIINKILDVLSWDVDYVNNSYLLPLDNPNFMFKPLIKVKNRYILMNLAWCSPAFYEALSTELRNKDCWKNNLKEVEETEAIIGLSFEEYVISEFNKNNIVCKSGNYKIGKISGQCDVIIESKDTIVFIELKKKALTKNSKSGDDVNLILDLSKSLLDAQFQAGKHEILLIKNDYIEFDDGTRLEFKDRFIERITLTLLDYGGFQDRNIINQLLRTMVNSDFKVNKPEYEKQFEELKKKMDKLKNQSEMLIEYDTTFNNNPFFNSWFLSLPQLLLLIDDSTDNESFIEQLNSVRSIGFNSLDFYFEYQKLKKFSSKK